MAEPLLQIAESAEAARARDRARLAGKQGRLTRNSPDLQGGGRQLGPFSDLRISKGLLVASSSGGDVRRIPAVRLRRIGLIPVAVVLRARARVFHIDVDNAPVTIGVFPQSF